MGQEKRLDTGSRKSSRLFLPVLLFLPISLLLLLSLDVSTCAPLIPVKKKKKNTKNRKKLIPCATFDSLSQSNSLLGF
jgi:hypothetical protein